MWAPAPRWGLLGLLGFELLVLGYTFLNGFTDHAWLAAGGSAVLLAGLARDLMGRPVGRWVLAAMSGLTLVRAYIQTAQPGVPAGLYPTYLVPLGFALWSVFEGRDARWTTAGALFVALGRTWFIVWYFMLDVPTLVVANIIGAAGAWVLVLALRPAAAPVPAASAAEA